MFTDIHEVKVVPWYSKEEWNEVFKKIYSNNIILQEEAYKKMQVWNLRCSKLPVGVECTMEILQIHLFDKKDSEVPCSKNDLQLMYSTSVMRFVNKISHLLNKNSNKKLTCYEVAESCGIPDWIINIRHDTAHNSELPSIELLNTAANYVLKWLFDNYWSVEATEAQDFFLKKSLTVVHAKQKIEILLNLWQSCKLYKFAGYHYVGNIPNSCLRSHLLSLLQKDNLLNVVDPDIPDDVCSLVKLETYLSDDGTSENLCIKMKEVLDFFVLYFKKLLPEGSKSDSIKKAFIKSLINCEFFLPITYNCDFYVNNNKIHGSLSSLWRTVLELYHNSELTTDLLDELAEITLTDSIYSRRLVAACWLSHISESLYSSTVTVLHENVKENKMFAANFLKKDLDMIYSHDIEITPNQPSLPNLNLSKNGTLKNHILENIVKKTIMNPNRYTVLYLPSLLNILNPPLDPVAKNKILQLVETYTNVEKCNPVSDIIYTPDMLPVSVMIVGDNSEENCQELFQSYSNWSKQYGLHDWSNYPLGRLPDVSENSVS